MKLGIHAYILCSRWNNESLHVIDKVKELELDFIEIPLMNLQLVDPAAIVERLRKNNLDVVTSTVLFPSADVGSLDEKIRANGVKYLKDCVDATYEMGAKSFSGIIYSQHFTFTPKQIDEQTRERVADALREVADYAEQFGVTVGIEPANRYETNVINTCEQAVDMKRRIGRTNVKIHLDTFHMNIEEKSFYEAAKLAGEDLIHVHLCENDRGIPGTGHVKWEEFFKALAEIKYDGYAALESFFDYSPDMNTFVWRKLAPDEETNIRESRNFIRRLQEKFGL